MFDVKCASCSRKRALPTVSCALTIPDYVGDGKLMYDISMKHSDIVDWLNAE